MSTNPDFKVISNCGEAPELCQVQMPQERKKVNQGLDNQEDREREDEKEEKVAEEVEKETKEHYEDMVDDALLGVMDDVVEEDG